MERFLVFNRGSAYACVNPARFFLIPVNTQFHAKYGVARLDKGRLLLHSSGVVNVGARSKRVVGCFCIDSSINRATIRNRYDHETIQTRSGLLSALVFLALASQVSYVTAQSLDEVLGVRAATTQDGKKSQIKIDEVKDQTRDLLTQYKQVMKVVDGLKVYNLQQERLIRNQNEELAELEASIDSVTVIERQIGR